MRYTTYQTPSPQQEAGKKMSSMVLQGGRVIDPSAGRDGLFDVLVPAGTIAAIGNDLGAAVPADAERVDCRGKLVLPGLIDTHGHVYQGVTGRFGMNADL